MNYAPVYAVGVGDDISCASQTFCLLTVPYREQDIAPVNNEFPCLKKSLLGISTAVQLDPTT
jgi:hypothetical protein